MIKLCPYPLMNTPQSRQQVVENYIKAYNTFDVEGMLANLHPDIVFQNITNGQVDTETRGLEAFRQQAERATHYFRERQQIVTSTQTEGDTITVDINYCGVLAVDLPNGPKTGETLELQGQSVFSFQGDYIKTIQDRM